MYFQLIYYRIYHQHQRMYISTALSKFMIFVCLFFAYLHINIKKTTRLLQKCPLFKLFYIDLKYILLYISHHVICCEEVKPGYMCINLYFGHVDNIIFYCKDFYFHIISREIKISISWVRVTGINKNVIVHAVRDILIFYHKTFKTKHYKLSNSNPSL